jgi:uncharacterized protein
MLFKIQELDRKPIPFSVSYPPGALDLPAKPWRQVGDVQTEGIAELSSETLSEIRVRGSFQVRLETECDRCAEIARLDLDQRFQLLYQPIEMAPETNELEISEAQEEVGYYESNGVDLKDVLRESILLELPMHALCRPECQGVCPQCGINRNQGSCQCAEEKVDDRWASLKALSGKPAE